MRRSWLQAYQLFANSYTRQQCGQTVDSAKGPISQPCINQPLDFLDLHLYPITERTAYSAPPPRSTPCKFPNFWQNALDIVSTAKAANMPLAISQTWLRKVRDREWLQPINPGQATGGTQEAQRPTAFGRRLTCRSCKRCTTWPTTATCCLRSRSTRRTFRRTLAGAPRRPCKGKGAATPRNRCSKPCSVRG